MIQRRKHLFIKKHYGLILLLTVGGIVFVLAVFNAVFAFRPGDMHHSPTPPEDRVPDTSFSVVSLNTWRLCDPQRVPVMIQALKTVGNDLHPDGSHDSLPDILLFQELECEDSTSILEQLLSKTHWFDTNICALKRSGEPRSVVGIAVNRSRFEVIDEHALDLGRLFLDHGRCALSVTIRPEHRQYELHVAAVHHSPHPLRYYQTKHMVEQFRNIGLMEAEHVILGGDFNFTPRSKSYQLLTSLFADPLPKNRGKTHWIGGQIDFVLTSENLALLRPLDRKVAYEAIKPAGLFRSIYRCSDPEWSECPLSDHLPEGGLFAFREDLDIL